MGERVRRGRQLKTMTLIVRSLGKLTFWGSLGALLALAVTVREVDPGMLVVGAGAILVGVASALLEGPDG